MKAKLEQILTSVKSSKCLHKALEKFHPELKETECGEDFFIIPLDRNGYKYLNIPVDAPTGIIIVFLEREISAFNLD